MTADPSTPIPPRDFAASFTGFMDSMRAATPAQESPLILKLREHFGGEVIELPIVSESFGLTDLPNLHQALEAYLAAPGRSCELLGVASAHPWAGLSLAEILSPNQVHGSVSIGPVKYVNVALHDDVVMSCIHTVLLFVSASDAKLALLVHGPAQERPFAQIGVEVMAANRNAAEACLADIRAAMRKLNVYRGRIISLGINEMHQLQVHFHRLPEVRREQLILPEGILDRLDRLTLGVERHRDKLLRAGRHLKRGILLHGPPGTGKTFTAMHLAGQMRNRTIILLTGRSMGLLQQSCRMARLLQPATVILEDVDLIAEERTHQQCGTLLYELLNEMDGLSEDMDVIFLLTTNRPDLLEPALASRPGRIDQAVEVPLPDEQCRKRLFDLYGRGLHLSVGDASGMIRKTQGVSAAFIRELLRKAALFAADDGDEIQVTARHIDAALQDMVVHGGELTTSLLGAKGFGVSQSHDS